MGDVVVYTDRDTVEIRQGRRIINLDERCIAPGEVLLMDDNRLYSAEYAIGWVVVASTTIAGRATVIHFSKAPVSGVRWDRIGTLL